MSKSSHFRTSFYQLPILFVVLGVLLCCGYSVEAAAPKPQSKKQALEDLEHKRESEEQHVQKLEREMHEIEGELKKTRRELVSKARAVQDSEAALKSLEDRIAELEHEKNKTESSIQRDKRSIGDLVLALERLRRLPPEVIIARPGAPIDTARSSMLIGYIVPVLNKRAKALREDMERLQDMAVELKDKRESAAARVTRLNNEYSQMSSLMRTRENLYKRTRGDYEEHESELRQIAKKASNLKDLVARVDEDNARERTRNIAGKAVSRMSKAEKSSSIAKKTKKARRVVSMPKQGSSQLPVSGLIRVQYGQEDSFGAKSKGIKIEGRSGALVVAPMGGIVRFAGEFKNYGNLIIIEHEKGYHSLVAGLKKIDTVVGQTITAGEPVGKLPSASRRENPVLYYELRFKGQSVNPAKKFAELS